MKHIIFTTHALERAQSRIWPDQTYGRIERLLMDAWRRGPAKLAMRAGRTYWVISDPTAVLVTINEKGTFICKTVLNSEEEAQEDEAQHEAKEPRSEPDRGVCRIVLEVTYDKRPPFKHDEVKGKLEHLARHLLLGKLITKSYKVVSYETTSTVEVIPSSPEPVPKET